MVRIIVLFLYFLSGLTGLIYEIVWMRIFGLIFGNTTLAISTVLSAYMLGLAWGGLQFGKYTKRIQNHFRIYALLELGVGISAFAILIFIPVIDILYKLIFPYLQNRLFIFYLLKFLLSFILMLPATFLMGGTLPIVSYLVVKRKELLGSGIGILYGLNTFGAVCGSFLAGFFFIRLLGVNETVYLAVSLNIFIFIVAFRYSQNMKIDQTNILMQGKKVSHTKNSMENLVLMVMAGSGFAAMAYEVLWSRILTFVLTNSIYAFSVMLTTFLLGIAIGSYFGGRIVDRIKNPINFLGWTEVNIALTALLTAFLLANFAKIHRLVFIIDPETSWTYWNGIRFLESLMVMFLPTFLMGVSFPIASKILIPNLFRMGSGLGKLYFYNTLGGLLGAFLTGFVFIKFFGSSISLITMVAVNLTIGLYLIFYRQRDYSHIMNILYASTYIILLLIVFKFTPKAMFARTYSISEENFPIIDYREGIEGTVTVHQGNLSMQRNKRINVDGLNVAGTSFILRTLQLMQGYLPQFVHPEARQVLQIGFGTGQTSAAVLNNPVKNFKLVEISKDVLDLSALHFWELNEAVMEDPRFHFTISDGKNYIKNSTDNFDIIMNDANYAVATTSASLFTKDHFENCKARLKPGGILSTWMTTDLDPGDFQIVLKTFQSVFPYTLLWMAPNCINKQVVLMGSTRPMKLDFKTIQIKLANPDIKNDLQTININSIYDLLNCLVLDSEGIKDIGRQAHTNSDNHPILEFSTKAVRSRDRCAFQNLAKILNRPSNLKALITNLPEEPEQRRVIEQNIQRYYSAARELLMGMLEFYQGQTERAFQTLLDGSRKIPESSLAAEYFKNMDMINARLDFEVQQNPQNLEAQLKWIRSKISQSEYKYALTSLNALVFRYPDNTLLYYELARCYLALTQVDSAEFFFKKSLDINPQNTGSWYFLGVITQQKKQYQKAIGYFDNALRIDPRMYEVQNELGKIFMAIGAYDRARYVFEKSLNIMEFQPDVFLDLAKCYIQLKRYEQAIVYSKKALRTGNRQAEAFFTLGNANFLAGNYQIAVEFFIKSVELDSSNSEYHYNLGNSLVVLHKYHDAIQAYQKAIKHNHNEPDYYNNLALSYRALGNLSEALSVFHRGLKLHPDSQILLENYHITKKIDKTMN